MATYTPNAPHQNPSNPRQLKGTKPYDTYVKLLLVIPTIIPSSGGTSSLVVVDSHYLCGHTDGSTSNELCVSPINPALYQSCIYHYRPKVLLLYLLGATFTL